MGLALFARTLRTSLRPTNSLPKPKSAIGFTRLHCALARFLVAGIALGRDLVSGQVDVLGTKLEEVVD